MAVFGGVPWFGGVLSAWLCVILFPLVFIVSVGVLLFSLARILLDGVCRCALGPFSLCITFSKITINHVIKVLLLLLPVCSIFS